MKAILALGMLPPAALAAPRLALRPVWKKNRALRRKPFPGHTPEMKRIDERLKDIPVDIAPLHVASGEK